MNGCVVVVIWLWDYPQPSTPLPCFKDVTIKPGGQMGPSSCMEGGASLAVLTLTQFNFLLTRTQKVRIYHPSESRWSSSAVPAGYYSRHRQVMSRGGEKN